MKWNWSHSLPTYGMQRNVGSQLNREKKRSKAVSLRSGPGQPPLWFHSPVHHRRELGHYPRTVCGTWNQGVKAVFMKECPCAVKFGEGRGISCHKLQYQIPTPPSPSVTKPWQKMQGQWPWGQFWRCQSSRSAGGYFSWHDESRKMPHATSFFSIMIEASMGKDKFSLSFPTQCVKLKFFPFWINPLWVSFLCVRGLSEAMSFF